MFSTSLTSAVLGSVVWQKERSMTAFHPLALSTSRSLLALSTKKENIPEKAGVKLLVGAAVCLTYEFALGHYLEFIKIMKQTKPQFSYMHLTQEIMHTKGLVGIWDGFFPWGALQAVAKGSVFSWGHSIARTALTPVVVNDKISKGTSEVIAGGIGGGFQGIVLSPTLLLKTRVMTDPIFREQMTPLETMSRSMRVGVKVIHKEGVAALMKGSGIFSLKRVADWSTRFFFSVQAENIVYKRGNPDHVLTTSEQVVSSLLGGVVSAAVTLPMDVLVAQIQQASKAGEKVSAVKLFQQQYRDGGINKVLAFGTTGFVARFIHASFTTMIMKTATSVVYDMVEGRNSSIMN